MAERESKVCRSETRVAETFLLIAVVNQVTFDCLASTSARTVLRTSCCCFCYARPERGTIKSAQSGRNCHGIYSWKFNFSSNNFPEYRFSVFSFHLNCPRPGGLLFHFCRSAIPYPPYPCLACQYIEYGLYLRAYSSPWNCFQKGREIVLCIEEFCIKMGTEMEIKPPMLNNVQSTLKWPSLLDVFLDKKRGLI